MKNKKKALIGLTIIGGTCMCYFANNNHSNFTKAEDVIHTVLIDPTHNHLPETTGKHTLVNEVGTEVNCKVSFIIDSIAFKYFESYCRLDNTYDSNINYSMDLNINGITSFEILIRGNTPLDALYLELCRGTKFFRSRGMEKHTIVTDEDGLSTSASICIPVVTAIEFEYIKIQYSETKCRELSNV